MAFQVYLRVVSTELDPSQISDRLGHQPDKAQARGEEIMGHARAHSTWTLTIQPGLVRPEDAEGAILAWEDGFKDELRSLVDNHNCAVSLAIVQEISDLDDPESKGIFLSHPLLVQLTQIGASLDIDQYVLHECGSPVEGC